MNIKDYYQFMKHGCYIGVHLTEESIEKLYTAMSLMNIKKPAKLEDETLMFLRNYNDNPLYSLSINLTFQPSKIKEYTAKPCKLLVNGNQLVLCFISPELHKRRDELLYQGFTDDAFEHFLPHIVLSHDYSSEKLKIDLFEKLNIVFKGEVFQPNDPLSE